jgi:hypothetical protein
MTILMKIASPPAIKRAPGWSALRRRWVKEHGACAYCGITSQLAVHHIVPLHIDKTRELDETNLITLCERKERFCHYVYGHLYDWWKFNPTVAEDAAAWSAKIQNAPGGKPSKAAAAKAGRKR